MLVSAGFLADLTANLGWAIGLAGAMFGLTAYASLLLSKRKEDVALWLMGAQTEAGWSKSFVTLFDSVFGAHHLSLRCLIRSTIASLLAVMIMWLLMGNADMLSLRMQSAQSLGWFLVTGLLVNLIADYLSLLETRWLLGRMPRNWLMQIGVLLFDFLISAAIIWIAIFLYLRSPLHEGDIESFAEILGVFSVFSVFFYSTFLTSVWTWAYIASTWIMRLVTRVRLADRLDVEGEPLNALFFVLSVCLGGVTFLGAMASSMVFNADEDGITTADRTLCQVFKGQVCLHVADLTQAEHRQLEFLTFACEGGVTNECISRAGAIWNIDGETAARLWQAACNGGDAIGCTGLGYLHTQGIGMDQDPQEAARLYRKGCDGGDALGCTNLGNLQVEGIGMDQDPQEAALLYRLGCDGGEARGCTNLGYLHVQGIGMDQDPQQAARLYRQGCDGGDALGCSNLGVLHESGIGMDQDPQEAALLYRLGCDGGEARGCTNLGYLHAQGIGMDEDLHEAARLYRQGCDGGHAQGCTNLGILNERGIGVAPDPQEAARLYRMGCDGGNAPGCTNLGVLHESGIGVAPDPQEAARLYRMGCDGGSAQGCTNLGILNESGIGVAPDPQEAARLYRMGCDGGNAQGCTNLGVLHESGIGVAPDTQEAARLYRQGCDGGHALGCSNLGILHENGIGMDPDPQEAARLYRMGCEVGHQDACGWADALEDEN